MRLPMGTLLEGASRTSLTLATAIVLTFSSALLSGPEEWAHAQQAAGKQAAAQNANAPLTRSFARR
jgi:hypothetical protein